MGFFHIKTYIAIESTDTSMEKSGILGSKFEGTDFILASCYPSQKILQILCLLVILHKRYPIWYAKKMLMGPLNWY